MVSIVFIQVSLLLVILVALVKILASRGSHAGSAWHKIGLVLLGITMIVAVMSPDTVTMIANMMGVGRGTDLVVYIIFAAFIYYVINQYLKTQELRDMTFRLARKVALMDAQNRYKEKASKL